MQNTSLIPQVVIVFGAVLAGLIDARTFRIPNLLTVPLLLSGFAYHAITGGGAGLQASLFGAAFGFGVIFVLYLVGGMGAGDVKLMTAIGAWLQAEATLHVFVVAALLMGAYSIVMLVWQRRLGDGIRMAQLALLKFSAIGRHIGGEDRVEDRLKRGEGYKRLIPFAVMLMFAVIAVVAWSHWTQS
jgi:prepilin peptidase CpaA